MEMKRVALSDADKLVAATLAVGRARALGMTTVEEYLGQYDEFAVAMTKRNGSVEQLANVIDDALHKPAEQPMLGHRS
jgi:hypothetical protein